MLLCVAACLGGVADIAAPRKRSPEWEELGTKAEELCQWEVLVSQRFRYRLSYCCWKLVGAAGHAFGLGPLVGQVCAFPRSIFRSADFRSRGCHHDASPNGSEEAVIRSNPVYSVEGDIRDLYK